jgi:FMN phosphatase YigB (HAD superfamily)
MTNYSKPIIFCDWYGVLSNSLLFVGIPDDNKARIQPIIFEDNKKLLKQACHSLSGKEFCRIIASRIDMKESQLEEYYQNGWNNVTWNQELLDLLQSFRKDYFLVLVSDNLEQFMTIVAPKLTNYFDSIHCSFHLKSLKSNPDYSFWSDEAKRFNSDIREAILIDDTLINRQIFEKVGKMTFESVPSFVSQPSRF